MEDFLNLEKTLPTFYYALRTYRREKKLFKLRRMSMEEIMRRDAQLFKERVGRELDWTNLQSYTEKMQWEKLFHTDPIKATLTDKYRVRNWVSKTIGSNYLIPLIGVWKNAKDIDFNKLPDAFVLKTNCASSDVIIVKDRKLLTAKDIRRIRCKLNFYLRYDWGYHTFELHYSKIEPLIVAEEYVSTDDSDLPDYKFLCFDGQPYFCWVDFGRYHEHKRNMYDLNWNLQNWNQRDYGNKETAIEMPINFDKMIDIAKALSHGFSQVRVDLYNINGKIMFGELTFTNGSGFEPIIPIEKDYELGELWKQECKVPMNYIK